MFIRKYGYIIRNRQEKFLCPVVSKAENVTSKLLVSVHANSYEKENSSQHQRSIFRAVTISVRSLEPWL